MATALVAILVAIAGVQCLSLVRVARRVHTLETRNVTRFGDTWPLLSIVRGQDLPSQLSDQIPVRRRIYILAMVTQLDAPVTWSTIMCALAVAHRHAVDVVAITPSSSLAAESDWLRGCVEQSALVEPALFAALGLATSTALLLVIDGRVSAAIAGPSNPKVVDLEFGGPIVLANDNVIGTLRRDRSGTNVWDDPSHATRGGSE